MPTPTTTFASIRDTLVTQVAALTPARLSAQGFVYAPRSGIEYQTAFREWAEGNDSACLRFYDVTLDASSPSPMSDGSIQREEGVLEIVVAYPMHYAMYGSDNAGELADVMEADIRQIRATVGIHGAGNWSALSNAATPKLPEDVTYEDGDGVRFAVLRLGLEYYYDTV